MKSFNYASTSSIKENLTSLILGVALIVIPIVYPFGIRIGAKPILGPVPTTILMIIAGLYMLYTAYRKIRQARALSAKGGVITVDDNQVTYPIIRKGSVEQENFSIAEVSETSYDEEDGILTVALNDGKTIKFDVDFFDSLDQLKEFAALLQK
ncbi:hypothetical protein [Alistipes sp.]|uniref:hypothetical protein n=1 Tax=Alistipes sp. TaxID=1872444 RepID=UPI0025BBE6C5|nr:hypothetical protein [Alistipes sp.]MCI7140532.1 hypothetical protein [Alistipes sp.]MDY5397665.1 hypothetical protein [Alistipes sp.]